MVLNGLAAIQLDWVDSRTVQGSAFTAAELLVDGKSVQRSDVALPGGEHAAFAIPPMTVKSGSTHKFAVRIITQTKTDVPWFVVGGITITDDSRFGWSYSARWPETTVMLKNGGTIELTVVVP
jgi:hypothetical protein